VFHKGNPVVDVARYFHFFLPIKSQGYTITQKKKNKGEAGAEF
jgi:hypothetical protein